MTRHFGGIFSAAIVAAAALCGGAWAGPLLGQIVPLADNPRWLFRYPDRPFFMCGPGDPEGFLYRGELRPDGTRSGDQLELIRKLAGTGANCIYLMAIRSHGGDGDATENPFIDHDPHKGLNPAVLDQWEVWFRAMDHAGIVIYFFFYDDSTRVWETGDAVGDEERQFIHGIVGRFKHHRNLIWCIAEEYQENFSARRASNIAAEIRAADDRRHPIAIHKLPGTDFSEFADDPNIDQFAIQLEKGSADQLHRWVVEAWRKAAGRYNLNMSEAPGFGTGRELREKIWACAMGGAYVMVIGMDIATTPVEDLKACGYLRRFFEATDFVNMAPHDELRAGDTTYVMAAPGRTYILYGRRVLRGLGVRGLPAGRYMVRWVDCASGLRRQAIMRLRGGVPVLRKPTGFGRDVAAYLQRLGP